MDGLVVLMGMPEVFIELMGVIKSLFVGIASDILEQGCRREQIVDCLLICHAFVIICYKGKEKLGVWS